MPQFNFVGPAYRGRSIAIDTQELVNFYLEKNYSGSKSQYSLIPTPGLKLLANIPGYGGSRGFFTTAQNRMLIAKGNKLYELYADYSYVELGTLNSASGRVSFAEVITSTGSIVMLVDGGNGYTLITETNAFATLVNGDNYHPGTSIISINGRFVQNTGLDWYSGQRFTYSGQYDQASIWDDSGLVFGALGQYFTAEASADPILNIQTINGEIWLFGSQSTEVWYYTGDTNQLFARVNSGAVNNGVSGNYAACSINNTVAWSGSNVGGNGSIWLGSGYIPQKISTGAIDYIISQMNDISDCIALAYQREGHLFFIFTFISGNRTLVYDLSTQEWHERGHYDVSSGRMNYHRVVCHALWNNQVIVGDYGTGNIYEWDLDTNDDNGETVRRIRTCQHVHDDRKRLFFRALEIDVERGTGSLLANVPTAIGAEPKVMLQTSDDGGFTWSNELWSTLGTIGNRLARVRYTRLGMSRDRIFRVTFTDPNKFIVVDASIDVQKGIN
jgi:hypothetical protein